MNIGLDYDDTFTRDPIGWTIFVRNFVQRGHKVYIVTWRDEEEAKEVHMAMQYWGVECEGIYATDRKKKERFMYGKGIRIDVMIDDMPHAWVRDMERA
jgi:hypothetical protein